jgi:hypothetical protein
MLFHAIPSLTIPMYLDPGSGSFLVQTLLALVLGSMVTLRLYWKNIKEMFTRRDKNNDLTD